MTTGRTYVFVGSTLSHEHAREHLPGAVFLPPIQQGDVLRLLPERPRVIAIIDGLFRAVPSVWHKEILAALDHGCHVFGASSMGALRAAELHRFGMRGVGAIYRQFAEGILEDDDEVAVAHAPAEHGFRELSLAMVNIRDIVERAVNESVITASEAKEVITWAKGLFYPERTMQGLCARAPALRPLVETFGPLLKERDAIALLQEVRVFLTSDPGPYVGAEKTLERTYFFHELETDVARSRKPRRTIGPEESVQETGLQLFALRKEALVQILARRHASATDTELEMALEQLRAAAQLVTEDHISEWLTRSGLTLDATKSRLHDMIALQKVEEQLAYLVDLELPDLAAVLSAFKTPARTR